jgi:uncharacterized repeat protein (TIGR02543 family)
MIPTGYMFSGWTMSGTGSFSNSNTPTTVFTIGSNTTITANFSPICYTMTSATIPAGGTVTVGTPSNCSGGYVTLTQIQITAGSRPGYIFTNWSGTGGSFENEAAASTTFTLGGNATVTANYRVTPIPGDVNGSGIVDLTDLMSTNQYSLSLLPNTAPFDTIAADVNANGTVDGADLQLIIKKILKLIP